jgi:ariadne-1
MTCLRCGFEFCWVCGHEWATHEGDRYECNAFKSVAGEEKVTLGEKGRLAHYCRRYADHKLSLDQEAKNEQEFRGYLTEVFRRRLIQKVRPSDVPATIDAIVRARATARDVLMWSYAHALMLEPDSTDLRLFEFVQQEAEKAMHKFTYAVEVQKTMYTEKLVAMAAILTKTTETLLKHVDDYS